MRTNILVPMICLVLFATTSSYAASNLKANIPFQFTAGGKVLPAGEYEFTIDLDNLSVRVASSSKGGGAIVPFITRLAPSIHSTATDAHIVFDKIGDTYTLSEMWEPDTDGFLLHATQAKHEHHVLHARR